MINKDAVIADIMSADNGDIVLINEDVRVVVLKNFSIKDQFVQLEKLILNNHKKDEDSFMDTDPVLEAPDMPATGTIRLPKVNVPKVEKGGKIHMNDDNGNPQTSTITEVKNVKGNPDLVDIEFNIDNEENAPAEKIEHVVPTVADVAVDTVKQAKKPKKDKLWAPKLKLIACSVCGKNDRPHMGKGRCTWCYFLSDADIADGKQYQAPAYKPMKPRKNKKFDGVGINTLYGKKDLKDSVEANEILKKESSTGFVIAKADKIYESDEEVVINPEKNSKRSVVTDKDRSYCQSSNCKHKNVLYSKATMFDHVYMGMKFFFCSHPCMDHFIDQNS